MNNDNNKDKDKLDKENNARNLQLVIKLIMKQPFHGCSRIDGKINQSNG